MFKTVNEDNELYSRFDLHTFTRSIALFTDRAFSTGAYALSTVCPCFKYDSWFSIFHILALGMCQLALNKG